MLAHEYPVAPARAQMPPPARLPSLPDALARRAAIFGAVEADISPDDRLPAIVAEMDAAAAAGEALIDADPECAGADPAYSAACDRFYRAMRRLCATPAAGLGGAAVKARALSGPWVADCAETAAEIAASLAADVLRLEAAGRTKRA